MELMKDELGPVPLPPNDLERILVRPADHRPCHVDAEQSSIEEVPISKSANSSGLLRRQESRSTATTSIEIGEAECNVNTLAGGKSRLKVPTEHSALSYGQYSAYIKPNGTIHAGHNTGTRIPSDTKTKPPNSLATHEPDAIQKTREEHSHQTTAGIVERKKRRPSKFKQALCRILPFVQFEQYCWVRIDLKMTEALDERMKFVADGFQATFIKQGFAHVNYSLQLVWSGRTEKETDMEPTIMFNCAKKDMNIIERIARNSPYIEQGCKLEIVESTPLELSGGMGFSVASKDLPPLLVEAYLAGAGNLCGVKARAHVEEGAYTDIFTLGGLVLIDKCCYVLTAGHALAKTTKSVMSYSDDVGWKPLGKVHAFEPSGSYNLEAGRTESVVKFDWALVEVPKSLWAENKITLPHFGHDNPVNASEEFSVPIVGYLNNNELSYGDVFVMTKSGRSQEGILSQTVAYVSIGGSGIYVRSIVLKEPLAGGDSGSWVIRDNKLCGYIYGGLENKPWAYMIPIETVFDRIRSFLGGQPQIELPSQVTITEILNREITNKVEPQQQVSPNIELEELIGAQPAPEVADVADSAPLPCQSVFSTAGGAYLDVSTTAYESFELPRQPQFFDPYENNPFTAIAIPSNLRTRNQKRKLIRVAIDKYGFNWQLWLVLAVGAFTDSYNLFTTNVILPSLAFVYWPDQYTWRETFIVCMTLTGSIVGQLLFGYFADRFGRNKAYGVTLLINLTSTVLLSSAFAGLGSSISWLSWIAAMRFLTGIGIGGQRPVSAGICTEWASTKSRSQLMAAVFLMQPLGQLAAQLVGLSVLLVYDNNYDLQNCRDPGICASHVDAIWRWVVGIGAIPAAIAIISRLFINESALYRLDVQNKRKRSTQNLTDLGNPISANWMEMDEPRRNSVVNGFSREDAVPEQFSKMDIVEYFIWQGNWRFLVGSCCCWFLLNIAFSVQRLGNSRLLAKIWTSHLSNVTVPAVPSWNPNPALPNATIYEVLKNNAIQNMLTVSIGSILGTVVLILSVNYFPRRRFLTWSFLWLTVLFLVTGIVYLSLFNTDSQTITVVLVGLCQFCYNWGPGFLMFMIPAEIFPTRYRCTCYGIAGACGTLGSIIVQATVSNSASVTNPDNTGLGMIFILFAVALVLGAVFSWTWIPEVQNARSESDGKRLPNKTLEDLGEGLKKAKEDGQVIGFRRKVGDRLRHLKRTNLPRNYDD